MAGSIAAARTSAAGADLQPRPLGPGWRPYAERLARKWRAVGGEVDLIEYAPEPGKPGTYVLTARDAQAALVCACESWTLRADGRQLWSVTVALRPAAGDKPARQVGVAVADEHEAAWAAVLGWLEEGKPLHASLEEAAATAKQVSCGAPARWHSGRVAFLVGGLALLATGAAYFVAGQGPGTGGSAAVGSVGSGPVAIHDAPAEMREGLPPPTALATVAAAGAGETGSGTPGPTTTSPAEPGAISPVVVPATPDPPGTDAGPAASGTRVSASPLRSSAPDATRPIEAPAAVPLASLLDTPDPIPPAPEEKDRPAVAAIAPLGDERAGTVQRSEPVSDRPATTPRAPGAPPVPVRKPNLTAVKDSPAEATRPRTVADAGPRPAVSRQWRNDGGTVADVAAPHLEPAPLVPGMQAGGFVIQVAAVSDPDRVPDAWQQLAAQFPDLGELRPRPAAPTRAANGRLLYRVAGGEFASRAEAEVVCGRIRALGGGCMVLSP